MPGSFVWQLDQSYTIPGTPHRRRLIVFERLEGEPPAELKSRSKRLQHRGG